MSTHCNYTNEQEGIFLLFKFVLSVPNESKNSQFSAKCCYVKCLNVWQKKNIFQKKYKIAFYHCKFKNKWVWEGKNGSHRIAH